MPPAKVVGRPAPLRPRSSLCRRAFTADQAAFVWSAGSGRSTSTSLGAVSSTQATSAGSSPSLAPRARRDHERVELLVLHELGDRLAGGATAVDARVDRHARSARRAARSARAGRGRRRTRPPAAPRARASAARSRCRRARGSRPGRWPAAVSPRACARTAPSRRTGTGSGSPPVLLGEARPVGDDPHVDARQPAEQPLGQRLAQAARARCARAAGRSARRWCRARRRRAAATSTTSSPSSTSRCAPSTEASLRSASSCSRSSAVGGRAGRLHVEQVEVGAEPLGRAPRAAHQPLRVAVRRDQREHPLADGGRARPRSAARACRRRRPAAPARCLASTSSATWRSATSRSAARFSTRKKLFSAASTRSGG